VSRQANAGSYQLGKLDRTAGSRGQLAMVCVLLSTGWVLAALGCYGPWISHPTAALTLSGVDMGEFVKFLPDVLGGSLKVMRQLFYLPPFVVVVSVALLIGSRQLRFPWFLRVLGLTLAIPVSLQLLPPAWSPSSLMTAEFRLQTIALGLCWALLAGFRLLGQLPSLLTGSVSAVLSLVAMVLPVWQFLAIKPAIDEVYRVAPAVGWGFPVCMIGLAIMAVGSIALVLRAFRGEWRSSIPWSDTS
jgi:hypothetical protein